jgi:hypothetical protein
MVLGRTSSAVCDSSRRRLYCSAKERYTPPSPSPSPSSASPLLQWCYSGVTVVSQRFYSAVTKLLHKCYGGITVVLQWCYSGVTVVSYGVMLLQRRHSGGTVVV